ncbi:heme biosynthesis protein HemY [Vibrio makurazakiensis]|uniref:heme biosynthesis protein HemY n=1 Tax=Vibrio makurazakiensis TaxID=2910250 RepID=UPI003D11DC97
MIRWIFLLAVLGAGLFAGTQFAGQQGYVLISIANKTVEMSVTTLVIFIVALLAGLFGLEFLLKKALRASSTTWNWFSVRKLKRSRRYTNEGIVKLLEGDWKAAEKKVTRWANHHDMPLLCYLVASQAAHEQGNTAQRDKYLELANQQDDSQLAVELTKAKQQISENNYSDAFDTLSSLKGSYPSNTAVLGLLKVTYIELKLWKPLLELTPKLIKSKLLTTDEKQELEQKAQCGLLHDVAKQQGSEGLITHWDKLPKKQKQNSHLIACFAKQLITRKADSDAYTVIKEAIKKSPTPELYALLPEMNLPDHHPVIVMLQATLKKDDNNAEAHSALAQFFMRDNKWPEAQFHLEKALAVRTNVSDYSYLSDALEKQNLTKAAHEVSRKALTLVKSA